MGKKLIDSIRKYLSLIGFIVAVVGLFITAIYNIPQMEHISDLSKVLDDWPDDIFSAGCILMLLGGIIGKKNEE